MRDDARQLVERYADLIKRLAYTYLRSADDAKDICQDVLLKLLLRDEPFASDEHERAWVIRVTANACKNELASARRRLTLVLDDEATAAAEDNAESPGDHANVLAAVNALPLAQREAIFLHYYEGYKIKEIALLTGRSEDAIAQAMSRGRKALREALGEGSI